MKHTKHITTRETCGTMFLLRDDSSKCKLCIKNRAIEKKKQQEDEAMKLQRSEELQCDKCLVVIGYVYVWDLEGSKFYCKTCKNT